MTLSMWKLTSTSNDSWPLWIEPQLSLFVFVFSLSSLLLVSASLDCFSLMSHCIGSRVDKAQVRIHPMLHAHVSSCSVLLLVSSTSPLTSSPSSTMWWTNTLRTSADEDLGTLAEYEPPTGYEPNDYHIMEAYVEYTQQSSVENGRMTSTTMMSPSARRSLHHCSPRSEKMMRAVDEPITLKTKVCRPVCRRPSVIVERGDPL